MSWRVAKSLLTLRDQVNAAFPNRDKSNDGTIGDTRHQAEHSEHNPDENGVVRAEDLSNDPAHGISSEALAQALVKSRDPRILYVISNRKISNSTIQDWAWRPYNGSNPHDHHVHISVVSDPHLYDDTKPWDLSALLHTTPIEPPAVVTQPATTRDRIIAAASASPLMGYEWNNRGQAPHGYIRGMAVAYGLIYAKWKAGSPETTIMAWANTGHDVTDALSWYNSIFVSHGMSNENVGSDTLRHLFVLMLGLGMRESSGKFCEGRDTSADNVTSETAEAGMFQTSWNIRGGSSLIADRFEFYAGNGDDAAGLGPIFHEGVSCSAANLENFGSGDGAEFQRMCKATPMFAIEVAGIGMRTIGGKLGHWGPLRTHAAEVLPAADALFKQVQDISDAEVIA